MLTSTDCPNLSNLPVSHVTLALCTHAPSGVKRNPHTNCETVTVPHMPNQPVCGGVRGSSGRNRPRVRFSRRGEEGRKHGESCDHEVNAKRNSSLRTCFVDSGLLSRSCCAPMRYSTYVSQEMRACHSSWRQRECGTDNVLCAHGIVVHSAPVAFLHTFSERIFRLV